MTKPALTRRSLLAASAGAAGTAAAIKGFPAIAQGSLDAVTFGTNWVAQAEHGGYYQAVANGMYRERGLDVTIRPGGPQVNHSALLFAGRIDFNMGANSNKPLNYAMEGAPFLAIASIFQKDPQVLLAHPGQGNDSLEALKGKPIMISAGARDTYWQFLKARYGYTDEQIRPYTFSVAPFLADKSAIMQGYLSSEPLLLQQEGIDPVVMLLADGGYDSYSTTIEVGQATIDANPDLVQRFVDASILGWVDFLYGDPTPAFGLIKEANPEMTDDKLSYAHGKLREYGIVDSGDSLELGIGAMTDERWKSFFDLMVGADVYPADLDYRAAYSLDFVNKGVGQDLKRQLQQG